VSGDLECNRIEVSGAGRVSGDCKALRIDVKGKFAVDGSLNISEGLDVSGVTEVGGFFNGASLRLSGKFAAERAVVTGEAEIYGSLDTRKGLKGRSILVRSGTRCQGPIIGEMVEVGGSGPSWSAFFWGQRLRVQAGTSRVEDVYGSRVVVGPGSRAGRIFAETIELGSGCDVNEVTYVRDLKMADHVKITWPVSKVDKLKEPPL